MIKLIKKKNSLISNVGWQNVEILKQNLLFNGVTNHENFYFVHSYTCINFSRKNILATYNNKQKKIVAAVNKKNIYGVQFHPEKSGLPGLQILKNFSKIQ